MNLYYNVHLIINKTRLYVGFPEYIPFKFLKMKVVKVVIYGCDYFVTLEGANNE